MHRLRAFIFAVMVSFSATRALAADPYGALVNEAIAAQASGDFARAHDLFAQAHELSPSARTWRGMGITSYQLGRYRRAVRELDAALTHSVRPLDAELREAVLALRARASVAIAMLRPVIQPAGAPVTALFVDGEAQPMPPPLVLPLDPGLHVLRVVAEGYRVHEQSVMLAPGSETSAQIALEPEPEPPPVPSVAQPSAAPRAREPTVSRSAPSEPAARRRRRRAAIALLGTGAVLGAVAGGLWALGQSRVREITRICAAKPAMQCSDEEYDAAVDSHPYRPLEPAISTLVAVGIAAGATSVALFIWNARERRRTVQVAIFPHGGVVQTTF